MASAILQCVDCALTYPINTVNSRYLSCDEPLEIRFQPNHLNNITPLPAATNCNFLQRYANFYPYLQSRLSLHMGEGQTCLVRSLHIEKETGLQALYFKNETQNPTWSFKDRGTACTVLNALSLPKMIGVQTTGCSSTVDAFEKGAVTTEQFKNPKTLDHVLENPSPPGSNQVLRKLKTNGGFLIKVNNMEIIAALTLVAQEGIFAQPASVTTVAGVIKAIRNDKIPKNSIVVAVTTGSGLKYPPILKEIRYIPQAMVLNDMPLAFLKRFKDL